MRIAPAEPKYIPGFPTQAIVGAEKFDAVAHYASALCSIG